MPTESDYWIRALVEQMARRAPTRGVCPACGTTRREYLATGFAGCALCYDALDIIGAKLRSDESGTSVQTS